MVVEGSSPSLVLYFIVGWSSGLGYLAHNQEDTSSNLVPATILLGVHVPRLATFPCKECVMGSIPLTSTITACGRVAIRRIANPDTRVRISPCCQKY